ncbi:hypothetical protein [Methanobacterium spitsbergense]|uniref:hypothetical protein n=1 Tax=Methanobacterium spitsbergense TaxID=2874285 RepID=UPI001CC004F4|nr:hypothetical protein [Methanobacterium spitsbergense]
MSKTLDVAMAGIIAGIVAYATSILGIGGTVIGAVLGAILYQIMSHLFKAPLEGIRTQNVGARIVYTIPLILIVAIEILFVFALLYLKPGNFFYILENATENNLFRSIGVGLIIMGLYPIIQPENIKKLYGYIIIIVGIIVLLGGFADFNTPITDFYSVIFSELGIIISLMVIAALSYVIIAITKESVTIINDKNETDFENYEKIEDEDVKYIKKLDYWFKDSKKGNDPKINNDDETKRDHDMR